VEGSINKGDHISTITALALSHSSSAPERAPLGSPSRLQSHIQGFPHSTVRFLRYLSVSTNRFCDPKKFFQAGKNLMLKSSRTIYLADASQSSRLNCPHRYMCGPRDLAHSVFPSLDAPHSNNERGRSHSIYQII